MAATKLSQKMQRKWLLPTRVFHERVYKQLRGMQGHMLHPDMAEVPRAQWDTIAWNAAWIAAEYFQDRTLKPSRWPVTPTNAACRKARTAGKRTVCTKG